MAPHWLGVLEGFYGTPYTHEQRLALIRWLPSAGLSTYCYAPKDDATQRATWRTSYDPERLEQFRELTDVGSEVGVDVAFVISPGLDWTGGEDDHRVLHAKLQAFYELGARSLAIAFDDVPPGSGELGASHAGAVAGAVAALPDDVRWATCPTDYAVSEPTLYLRAFAAGLPPGVSIMWTGPSIVSPYVDAATVRQLRSELGRPVVLADNYPVNDGAMSGALHLGPYPPRDPELPEVCDGLVVNLMAMPLASRIGAAAAAAWWRDPQGDRQAQWRAVLADVPGLLPLARACSSWLTQPGPDPELLQWAYAALDGDPTLETWLAAGCRDQLAEDWQTELEPWLQAWEWEAFAVAAALTSARVQGPAEVAFTLTEIQRRVHMLEQQTFGLRYAMYGVTITDDSGTRARRSGLVRGENLTDILCRELLDRVLL